MLSLFLTLKYFFPFRKACRNPQTFTNRRNPQTFTNRRNHPLITSIGFCSKLLLLELWSAAGHRQIGPWVASGHWHWIRMQRSLRLSAQPLLKQVVRGFSSNSEKIVASVLFERLPVVIPKIDPVVYAFQEFSFQWQQQYRRMYPDELLDKSNSRGKGDYQIDYVPAPRITEADKKNDKKSLQRALDRRLYLLLYGSTYGSPTGNPVWHFPEKVYESEETLRKCAESALEYVIGDLSHTYFVGNAPMGHMVVQATENLLDSSSFKRFFFKSQVIATNKFNINKCEDFVWVTKDEVLEYFPEQAEFLNKMIIS